MIEDIKLTKKDNLEFLPFEDVEIKEFIEDKIKSNPIKYGGDNGNTHLAYEYAKEILGVEIPKYLDSKFASLIRRKNLFLKNNPIYDNRAKNKTVITKKSTLHIQDIEST